MMRRASAGSALGARRALVVSHPAVLPANQAVYESLESLGWDLTIVVPDRWRHDYDDEPFRPARSPGLRGGFRPLPIVLAGREQRHVYRPPLRPLIRRLGPAVAFVEQE